MGGALRVAAVPRQQALRRQAAVGEGGRQGRRGGWQTAGSGAWQRRLAAAQRPREPAASPHT